MALVWVFADFGRYKQLFIEMGGRFDAYPCGMKEYYDKLMQDYQEQLKDAKERYYMQLTSFLEVDNSFFSKWHGDLSADDKAKEGQRRMDFQPGSFFSHEVSKVLWFLKY